MSIYKPAKLHAYSFLGEAVDNITGPAAGPHTQLANNIITAYLAGGRFFELKTVQILDELVIDKPCIDAQDEGYNVEWSQELKLEQAFDEYLKAWLLTHVLARLISGRSPGERGFVFNMSVGYNLEGIKSERVDRFIELMKNAAASPLFTEYKTLLKNEIKAGRFAGLVKLLNSNMQQQHLLDLIDAIPANMSRSITLSTMHGCPADEIESIAGYLMHEKQVNTFVKLNPTLLGYTFVNNTLHSNGFMTELDPHSFEKDIQYDATIPMLRRLHETAKENGVHFGIKLSNTLGVKNNGKALPGGEQYLSGRALYPLTIHLAAKIAAEFNGNIHMSYSGGITIHNIAEVAATGIAPVTLATDLLKPGGYQRLKAIAEKAENIAPLSHLHIDLIKTAAVNSIGNALYNRASREVTSIKVPLPLPLTDCYMAPCTAACPVHQDVADYISLVQDGRYKEALAVILDKNPLPHVTGYICDHQCMFHCTRQDYDEAVMIRDIKKFATEQGYNTLFEDIKNRYRFVSNKQKVAIIGAGPSGLSAAFYLAVNGFEVTVFEKEEKAGGIVRNVIPQFRIPEAVIEKDIDFISSLGVQFEFGVKAEFSIAALKAKGFKYIYLAIGAGIANEMELTKKEGTIIDAIPFLWDFNHGITTQLGKTVAIVGGGNSAMDSARAAKRVAGVEKVYILYRRTKEQMPADKEEFDAAIEDGVEFRELILPDSFSKGILHCKKMMLGEAGADGRRSVKPVDGAYEDLAIDTVITAIGEKVDEAALVKNGIRFEKSKPALQGNFKETSIENVFIGGDALRGPSTVIESAADGRKTAIAITTKEGLEFKTLLSEYPSFDSPFRIDKAVAMKAHISDRQTDITAEAGRCLSCSLICNKCVDVCPNRANVAVAAEGSSKLFKDAYQIVHIEDLCNECGNCQTFCPYNGSPYKQKLTLFSTHDAMQNSTNDGFFINKEKRAVTLRVGSYLAELELDAVNKNVFEVITVNQESVDKALAVMDTIVKRYYYLV
ncbi:MAG: putative selenate reductase subunit YgfK [Ignavibacteriales bacterium]|nr:putative selenate reductase subunit YgfK [Ignavibacteriales bacterium]